MSVIILQTYYSFIRGHAIMHVFIYGWRVMGQSTCLSCTYQCGPSQGWLTLMILLPHVLQPLSDVAIIWPLPFLFLHGVLQNLEYLLAMASKPFLVLTSTWGFCSFLVGPFLLNVSDVLGVVSEVVRKSFQYFPRKLDY